MLLFLEGNHPSSRRAAHQAAEAVPTEVAAADLHRADGARTQADVAATEAAHNAEPEPTQAQFDTW